MTTSTGTLLTIPAAGSSDVSEAAARCKAAWRIQLSRWPLLSPMHVSLHVMRHAEVAYLSRRTAGHHKHTPIALQALIQQLCQGAVSIGDNRWNRTAGNKAHCQMKDSSHSLSVSHTDALSVHSLWQGSRKGQSCKKHQTLAGVDLADTLVYSRQG